MDHVIGEEHAIGISLEGTVVARKSISARASWNFCGGLSNPRAQAFLKADADGSDWADARIAEALDLRTRTVERLRERFVTEGFDVAVHGKPRETPATAKRLSGKQEAKLIAMRLGPPPKGYANWTLRLLARKLGGTGNRGGHQPRNRSLHAEKNGMTNREIQSWVIPPEADAEFVACMEAVLETYEKPYDSRRPVLCMDEQPVQFVRELRQRIAASKNRPRRVDYEYERAGTASIFIFTESLAGWRTATARQKRTKLDWAQEVAALLEDRYAQCEEVILICDNLNTYTPGAFYEAFPPAKARKLVWRIRFCYTPMHGSWLNLAENELSSLTRQCISGRRFGKLAKLQSELKAWSTGVNTTQRGVDWQMKIENARGKLKSLYPKICV